MDSDIHCHQIYYILLTIDTNQDYATNVVESSMEEKTIISNPRLTLKLSIIMRYEIRNS
jgi:hypothetical protein